MKALRLYDKNDLRLDEISIPEIGEEDILVRVKSAAICGTDVRMWKNGAKGIDPEHPLVIGHELSGIIEKTGSKVSDTYKIGLRVAVAPNMGCGICDDCIRGNSHMCREYKALGISLDGGFAEYALVPGQAVRAGNVIPIDDRCSFDAAAIAEPLSCVYNGISQCRVTPGDYVLVIGAGPIGIMHSFMAKMSGAGKVFINDLSQERLDFAVGLEPFFIPIKDNVESEIDRLTNGHGADVIITACPVPSTHQAALRMAANYGRICFFGGLPADRAEVPLNDNLIHYKQLVVTGSTRASLKQFKDALGFVTEGIIPADKLVTGVYDIENIMVAMDKAAKAEGLKNVIHFM